MKLHGHEPVKFADIKVLYHALASYSVGMHVTIKGHASLSHVQVHVY